MQANASVSAQTTDQALTGEAPSKRKVIINLIDQLAALAKQNAETEGWSPQAAVEQHEKELFADRTAKNLADCLWLEAICYNVGADFLTTCIHDGFMLYDGKYDEETGYEDLKPGVEARLRQLILRLETTGSLLNPSSGPTG